MRTETRLAYNAYLHQLATINGVPDATKAFAVEPSVEQKLEERIRESSDFLQQINVIGVDQQKGEVLGLDVANPIASRTDTSGAGERNPSDPTAMDSRQYECAQTNFDTAIRYEKLDQWAKFPDFQPRIRSVITKQQARDRIMIGWNGTSRAANTNLAANPLLQDVNIGWLESMRVENAERVTSAIKIGDQADADYKNIDQAVMASINAQIAEWYADDPDLVVICGRNLLSDKYVSLAGDHDAPTERAALQIMLTNKMIGGKRTIMVPFFPANAFMVTKLANLSIYYQNGTRRRRIEEEPKKDRIADYQSVNEDYVVEDYACALLSEGILTPDGVGGWA